jgi:hypothetical protein
LFLEGATFGRIWWSAVSRVFYRIIQGPVPTLKDFLPYKELGKPLRFESMEREWAESISVYDDLDSAIEQAKRLRLLRFCLAKVVIPDSEIIEVAQTGRHPHHFSIYAPAWQVLRLVEGDAILVEKGQGNG